MSGSRILHGRYALPAEFRSGGMANVYQAADLQEGSRKVAVKILRAEHGDPVIALAFERETTSLMALGHSNIVRLLDAGRDPQTNERYLVFEWMESDLETAIGAATEWEEYLRRWGMPILRGLAHAHGSGVAHRDLKPANVLLDAEQRPQIADFGIAKIAASFAPGRTLRDWHSPPYVAREAETESNRYSRDVHAYGVMSLMIITGVDPGASAFAGERYDAIDEAMTLLHCPEEIADLLARCVSIDADERPVDAAVALVELEQILEDRRAAVRPRRRLYLSLAGARRYLEEEFDLTASADREQFILDELADGVGVLPARADEFPDGQSTEGHFMLFGNTLRLHAALSQDRDRLHLIAALAMRPSYLERERERAAALDLDWRFGPDDSDGVESIRELERVIEEHLATSRRERSGSASGLIGRWRRLLTAMRTAEMERAVRHPYRERRVEGRAVIFQGASEVPVELLGPAVVESTASGFLRGEVTLVRGSEALMRVLDGDPTEVPPRGEIRTDTGGTTTAIRRQHRALDAIEEGRSVRSDLMELIVRPELARTSSAMEIETWVQNVDEAKREIISRALGSPDAMHVEGPPGTGKTTLIAELILQRLRGDPDQRILLSSKTHAALDNVLERLAAADSSLRLIRGGRMNDERVSKGASEYLVDRQLKRWRKKVERQGRRYLARWAKEHGISERDVEISAGLEELAAIGDSLAELDGQLNPLQRDYEEARKSTGTGTTTSVEVLDSLAEQIDELRSRRKDVFGQRDELIDRLAALKTGTKIELRESATAELRERALAVAPERTPEVLRCLAMIKLLGEWHARFGRGDGFSGAALSRAQVVAATCVGYEGIEGASAISFDLCIVDEASQATPPEVLIPMTRAKSWILVGDSKQLPPFVDEALRDPGILAEHNLRTQDAEETLFSRWGHGLPAANLAELTLQHRMVPPISALISDCFYAGKLESAVGAPRADVAKALAAPVLWYSTSTSEERFELAAGTSWINDLEARVARNTLSLLDLAAEAPLEVAILTGYASQVAYLERILSASRWKQLHVECSTIDAYQGRESDVVVYLVTRSNHKGTIGFLRERPRLNVALSRARQGLIIVGDEAFIDATAGENPFRAVLSHIRAADDAECLLQEAPLP